MDRISGLPNDVLIHILSLLPTKNAVGTSILSPRWNNVWASVPVLDFDDSLFLRKRKRKRPNSNDGKAMLFMTFVEKVISVNDSPNFVKFRLHISHSNAQLLSRVNGWIQTARMRNVVELDIMILVDLGGNVGPKYLRLSPCHSLEVVKIKGKCGLHMPTSRCFPNLRIFDVDILLFETDDDVTTKLFTSLPRLEKLSLSVDIRNCVKTYDQRICFSVIGTALKSLDVKLFSGCDGDAEVVIDAPNLEYLLVKDSCLNSYLVKNQPAINEVNVDIGTHEEFVQMYVEDNDPPDASPLIELLQEVSNAKSLSFSATTMLAILYGDHANHANLPVFHSLTKLELSLYPSGGSDPLPQWLESSPNLEFLVLKKEESGEDLDPGFDLGVDEDFNWTAPTSVPTCLLLHLKEIEIQGLPKLVSGKFLKYVLQNAKVLKKFTFYPCKWMMLVSFKITSAPIF